MTNWAGGDLDLETGVFTADTMGTYSIAWGYHGPPGGLWLYRGGERVVESLAGRMLVSPPPLPQLVHMEAGDTVELQAGQAEDAATAVTFCVSLWQSEQ